MYNVFFIVLLLLMMEGLPSSSRYTTASFRHRHKKRTQALCVGGKWFQVGSFRFWQRSTCAKRRQAKLIPPAIKPVTSGGGIDQPDMNGLGKGGKGYTRRPSTIDFDLIVPSAEDGPKRNGSYDPSYGHEPYWVQGDWVFDKSPYLMNPMTQMCGIRCPLVYMEYGKICGRDKHYKYQTFDNYCQLKNTDCGGEHRWMVLYKGECFRDLYGLPRTWIHKRTVQIIEDLLEALPNHDKYVGFCENCTNPTF